MLLTDLQKAQMFKAMASKSSTVLARDFGLDKHYKSMNSCKAAVAGVKKEVLANPEKYIEFGITPEVVTLVQQGLDSRKASKNVTRVSEVTLRDKETELENMDYKDLVERGAKKSLVLLNKKLDAIGKTNKGIKDMQLGTMGTIVGIMFDKSRISKGEATEHIMLKARISEDLTPAQKLELILKMREINNTNGTTSS